MASYRSCCFKTARELLSEYNTSLKKSSEFWMFDAIRVYLETAICTAEGNVEAVNNILPKALAQAQVISRGRISAALYLLVATNCLQQNGNDDNLPVICSIRALEDVKHIQDLPKIRADMEKKSHILMAMYYLGCDRFGMLIKKEIHLMCFKKAVCSLKAIRQSIDDGNLMNPYRELYFCPVQSTFFYRKSQLQPDRKMSFLRAAFDTCKKTETVAIARNFLDVVNCSRSCMALFTECLIHTNVQRSYSRLLIQ